MARIGRAGRMQMRNPGGQAGVLLRFNARICPKSASIG